MWLTLITLHTQLHKSVIKLQTLGMIGYKLQETYGGYLVKACDNFLCYLMKFTDYNLNASIGVPCNKFSKASKGSLP